VPAGSHGIGLALAKLGRHSPTGTEPMYTERAPGLSSVSTASSSASRTFIVRRSKLNPSSPGL